MLFTEQTGCDAPAEVERPARGGGGSMNGGCAAAGAAAKLASEVGGHDARPSQPDHRGPSGPGRVPGVPRARGTPGGGEPARQPGVVAAGGPEARRGDRRVVLGDARPRTGLGGWEDRGTGPRGTGPADRAAGDARGLPGGRVRAGGATAQRGGGPVDLAGSQADGGGGRGRRVRRYRGALAGRAPWLLRRAAVRRPGPRAADQRDRVAGPAGPGGQPKRGGDDP